MCGCVGRRRRRSSRGDAAELLEAAPPRDGAHTGRRAGVPLPCPALPGDPPGLPALPGRAPGAKWEEGWPRCPEFRSKASGCLARSFGETRAAALGPQGKKQSPQPAVGSLSTPEQPALPAFFAFPCRSPMRL